MVRSSAVEHACAPLIAGATSLLFVVVCTQACTPAKPQSGERSAPSPPAADAAGDGALAIAVGDGAPDVADARVDFSASRPGPDVGAAPAKPASLVAKAVSPFAVRLTWDAAPRAAAGFEVQVKSGEAFVRAALVDATKREFVHHLRLPKQVLTYRVRAFNAQGASEPSPPATLTMPERPDPSSTAPVAIGPCVPLPSKPPKSTGCDPEISTLDGGTGHVVHNVPGAGNGCMRHLMGEYAGCTRELGVFMLQADIVVVKGKSDDGWPLLHAIAGAGQQDGAQIQTLRFARGRYTIVDTAQVCGERGTGASSDPDAGVVSDDLERCRPPFETCQRDPTPL